jgi:hypothetical protein
MQYLDNFDRYSAYNGTMTILIRKSGSGFPTQGMVDMLPDAEDRLKNLHLPALLDGTRYDIYNFNKILSLESGSYHNLTGYLVDRLPKAYKYITDDGRRSGVVIREILDVPTEDLEISVLHYGEAPEEDTVGTQKDLLGFPIHKYNKRTIGMIGSSLECDLDPVTQPLPIGFEFVLSLEHLGRTLFHTSNRIVTATFGINEEGTAVALIGNEDVLCQMASAKMRYPRTMEVYGTSPAYARVS